MEVECYGDEFEQYLTNLLREEGSIGRRRLFEAFVRGATLLLWPMQAGVRDET